MSAPYNSVLQKCEQAMLALIGAQAAPGYAGIAYTTKAAPCFVCYSESAQEDFPGSGNYKVKLKVSVMSMAETDASLENAAIQAHQNLCGSVFDFCKDANLALDITSAAATASISDFCVQGAIDRGLTAGISPNGDAWIDSIELELYACAANLS